LGQVADLLLALDALVPALSGDEALEMERAAGTLANAAGDLEGRVVFRAHYPDEDISRSPRRTVAENYRGGGTR